MILIIDVAVQKKQVLIIKKDNEIDYKEKYEILKKYQAFIKAQREKK